VVFVRQKDEPMTLRELVQAYIEALVDGDGYRIGDAYHAMVMATVNDEEA
jgi:hypothetical protein